MKKTKQNKQTKKHRVASDGVFSEFVVSMSSALFKMLCLRNLFPNLLKQHERRSKTPITLDLASVMLPLGTRFSKLRTFQTRK